MSESLKQLTAKGLFWGGMSNGIQQLLNLLFGIVLARLLDATDYGMIGVLAIFTAIANSLQESGFTVALANKKEITNKDYNAVFWFSILMGISMYTILFFCAPLIARFFNAPQLVPLSRVVFLGFVIASTGIAHNAYLFRNLMVKQKAMAQVPALILSGTVGITLAANGFSYWGLATQTLVYITVVNGFFWYFSRWRPSLNIDFRPIREMFGFSSKILITNVFVHANNNILSTILGHFYTKAEVGNYTQANKWNTMGFSLISGMISSVAQPILTQVSDDRERQLAVFRKMLRFTAFLSFPALFGLALIAEEFIVITVTDKWLACVPILQMLCIWGAFMPITILYTNMILSKGKSNVFMWNTIAMSLLQLVVMIVAHPYGIYTMIPLYITINILWLMLWQYFVHQYIGLRLWQALKDMLPFALTALLAIGVAYYLTRSIVNIYWLLLAKVAIAVAVYTFIMWISNASIFKESIQFIFQHKKNVE